MNTPPRRYAEGTKVPADKTRAELETLMARHGEAMQPRLEVAYRDGTMPLLLGPGP